LPVLPVGKTLPIIGKARPEERLRQLLAVHAEGSIARSIFAEAAGGAASELIGGEFVNGFVMAAFAHAWNQEGIGHNGGS
jgi:hypothetical protein